MISMDDGPWVTFSKVLAVPLLTLMLATRGDLVVLRVISNESFSLVPPTPLASFSLSQSPPFSTTAFQMVREVTVRLYQVASYSTFTSVSERVGATDPSSASSLLLQAVRTAVASRNRYFRILLLITDTFVYWAAVMSNVML